FLAGHSFQVVDQWSFHARVRHGADLDWTSPSHTLKARKENGDLLLDAAPRKARVDLDIQLALAEPRPAKEDVVRFSSSQQEGARCVTPRSRRRLPSRGGGGAPGPRRWVFLFESSGDRDPLLARTQIEVVRGLLGQADAQDTFAVLTAG